MSNVGERDEHPLLRWSGVDPGSALPMTDTTNRNALVRLAAATGIAGAAALATVAPAAAAPADVNPGCADIAPEGTTWHEFKIDEDPANGTYDAGFGVSITLWHVDAGTISWTATGPVAAFIVKGGPGAKVEVYEPPVTAEVLSAPYNPDSGKLYSPSHVTWCFPTDEPPAEEEPPADEPPTAELPPAEEPPAEEPPAEEPPAEGSPVEEEPSAVAPTALPRTEVLGARPAPAEEAAAPAALPRTGVSTTVTGLAGAVLAGLGTVLVRRSRRLVG